MKDLTIPVPNFSDHDKAEIELRVGGKKITYNFRVESFFWETEDDLSVTDDHVSRSLARICRLKKAIEEFDGEWELIQIFTPLENSKTIQVLYRKKMNV
jgi:hypothetical protein